MDPVGVEVCSFPVGVVCAPSSFFFGDLVSLPVVAVVAEFVPGVSFFGTVGAGFDEGTVCIEVFLAAAFVAFLVVLSFVDVGTVVAEAVSVVHALRYFLREPIDFSFIGDGALEDGLLDGDVESLGIHDVVVRVGY